MNQLVKWFLYQHENQSPDPQNRHKPPSVSVCLWSSTQEVQWTNPRALLASWASQWVSSRFKKRCLPKKVNTVWERQVVLASSLHMHKLAHQGAWAPQHRWRHTHALSRHFQQRSFPRTRIWYYSVRGFTNSISKVLLNKHFSKTFKNVSSFKKLTHTVLLEMSFKTV